MENEKISPPLPDTNASATASIIGIVRPGNGKAYEVKWDQSDKCVYVSDAGWSNVGMAGSADNAMIQAAAWFFRNTAQPYQPG